MNGYPYRRRPQPQSKPREAKWGLNRSDGGWVGERGDVRAREAV